jgi:hypothetical protein
VTTLCAASLLLLSGCAELTVEPTKKVTVDKTLPVVNLTKNGVITDMKTVAFEWKSITDPRVEGIYVYKKAATDKEKEPKYYKTIDTRFATHYLDRGVEPNKQYSYAFRVFTKNSQGLNSKVFVVKTLPVLHSVVWIHSIEGLPRMAKIIWRPHSSERVAKYIIERRAFEDKEFEKIAELSGRLNAEYIDKDLADNHVYMYRIRVKTYDGIVSAPSQVVKSVTKPLPDAIMKIEATKNLPKEIALKWSASKQKDFERYYLYRSDDVDGSYDLIAKLYNNHFNDKINEDGKAYFYRVSVVDKDGLESEHDKNTVMGRTLVKPAAPAIVEAKMNGSNIEIRWQKNDPRAVSYKVLRELKKGWFDKSTKEFRGIRNTYFTEKNVMPDRVYTYRIYSIDKNGIVSLPSTKVTIQTPESKKITLAPKVEAVQEEVVNSDKQSKSDTVSDTTEVVPTQELDLNGL